MGSIKEWTDSIQARLGINPEDWVYSVYATVSSDGVPRTTVVYFLKNDAPEFFASRARADAVAEGRDAAFRAFFERMW